MMYLVIAAILILIFAVSTYPKWSYNEWYKRCEINALHPNWYPKCAINFLKKDSQWFIDNGYGKYTRH